MSNQVNRGGGIAPTFILFLLFLGLKLTGFITWSWWWVTCPLWAGTAIVALFFLVPCIAAFVIVPVAFVGVFVYQFFKNIFKRKQ